MNRKLFLLCLMGAFLATSAYAKCDGGTMITGKSGSFCKSNVKMNWWSAYSWCKANDRSLATIYEACPSWNGNIGEGQCSELSGSGDGGVWTSTASGSDSGFSIALQNGYVNNKREDSSRLELGSALCR